MKYAAYYKKQNHIVSLTDELDPNKWSIFIYRQDYVDSVPPNFDIKNQNILFGGQAFYGETYDTLPLEIETQVPDKSIYTPYSRYCSYTALGRDGFKVMSNALHLRLSLDGKEIWKDFERQLPMGYQSNRGILFLHDFDLTSITNGKEVVENLIKEFPIQLGVEKWVGMKFPLKFETYDELVSWCSLSTARSFFNAEVNGLITDEQFAAVYENEKIKTSVKKIDYIVTKFYKDEDDFLKNGLLKLYNQVLFLRSHQTRILLRYENNFFVHKEWEDLIDLFNTFIKATKNPNIQKHSKEAYKYETLYSFIFNSIKSGRPINKEKIRNLFLLVYEENYDVFKAFYEGHSVELVGGEFINDT